MNVIEIIRNCSGMNGEDRYNNLTLKEFIEWFRNDISYNREESKREGEKLIVYLESIIHDQEKIHQEMVQSMVYTWCISHDVDPRIVTYKDGNICIPVNF